MPGTLERDLASGGGRGFDGLIRPTANEDGEPGDRRTRVERVRRAIRVLSYGGVSSEAAASRMDKIIVPTDVAPSAGALALANYTFSEIGQWPRNN